MKSLEIRDTMFVGEECEGMDKGIKTLFIPRGAPQEEQFLEIGQKLNITRFYFGAGNKRGMSQKIIDTFKDSKITSMNKEHSYILEIDDIASLENIPDWLLIHIRIIFSISFDGVSNKMLFISSIKFVDNEKLGWCRLTCPIVTKLSDIRYERDTPL